MVCGSYSVGKEKVFLGMCFAGESMLTLSFDVFFLFVFELYGAFSTPLKIRKSVIIGYLGMRDMADPNV